MQVATVSRSPRSLECASWRQAAPASKASHGHTGVLPSYRKGAHLSMWAVGWLHKRKVQTCVVIAIVDGSGGCHAVLVCV